MERNAVYHPMHSWYAIFNFTECVLWWVIGAAAVWRARRKSGPQKSALMTAAFVFLVFGVTDWLEAPRENAVPLWLWILKIACGAGLLGCRFTYVGWNTFSWRRPELWFGLACLGAVLFVIRLQAR